MYYRVIKSETPVSIADREPVRSILERVRLEGDKAVRPFSQKFDNFNPPSFRGTVD